MRIVITEIRISGEAAQVQFNMVLDDGHSIDNCKWVLRSDWLVSLIRVVREIEEDLRRLLSKEVQDRGQQDPPQRT